MRQNQCFAALGRRRDSRRIIAGRKILTLPVVMLPRRPDWFAVALDLLVVIESPYHVAFEITLDEFEQIPGAADLCRSPP